MPAPPARKKRRLCLFSGLQHGNGVVPLVSAAAFKPDVKKLPCTNQSGVCCKALEHAGVFLHRSMSPYVVAADCIRREKAEVTSLCGECLEYGPGFLVVT